MFAFRGRPVPYCDGISRRSFLRVGALGLGSLTLADMLRGRALASSAEASRPKAAIMIFLSGGPSHIDTWDMKPDAPVEMRGEFKPIATNVPGMQWCEHMPRQAGIADKIAVLRGVQTVGNHTGNEFFSGFAWEQGKPDAVINQKRPAVGSVVSRLRGGRNNVPAYVSLHDNQTWEHPYYLGEAHKPFRTILKSQKVDNPALANLARNPAISLDQVADRKALLHTFDSMRRDVDTGKSFDAMDAASAKALEIVTSGRVRDAFDLSKEPDRLKARYGTTPAAFDFVPGHEFLMARRLIEAGAGVVSLAVHGWDTHENNFPTLRKQLPIIDQAFSALINDLETRGMLDDVVLIMGGEMGRSPKVVGRGGRDHWPVTGVTVMAGGGLKTGQIVGASDARGERPKGRPITPQMMIATVYQALGIDPATTINDHSGRPQYLLDEREPIAELV